ncbi:LysR substrate-binding domain-containing protein [Shewanella fidelis]|uniref:LysR substrate-binding domain-containing protein n=1 Tax=Shewanella fidelis TaxID=173509 RepID=A0AAW8NMX0_9GAMM|nr:LysR substrate-binding domain-containing protein [Shewanella fidelis]MDR8524067.1 LysR substrate-binding domain-containing protein [Shewanella fidelis]MDW4810614.1 LysR substrate-binding domain-containing protein [Shewanella fidelis]MDW4814735.1 LysR substrate-binding domain-containing protein [Shewanella fidelis]MDW4818825.1 LysR substrate-binding domain-containing protein [Shewanella fidelis]MDW4823498.1 LysR substrate-binding domain-containing protein [Shewanella fidelis]
MRITLKQLAIFEAVARSGQVAKAADLVNLSSPAASMALSELEKQLDTRLFERVGNRLRLNSQGSLLLPLATEALQKIEQIEHAFSPAGAELGGVLNVSASSTIGNYLLAKSAVAFCQQHTNTLVNVDIDNTQAVINAVLEFRSEMGFIEGQCLDSRIAVEAWHKDKLLIFCHPAHPLAGQKVKPSALHNMPWVMREEGSGTRDYFVNAANALGMQLQEKFRFSTPDAIKQAVKQGAGLGVLSELTLEKELIRKELAIIHVEGLLLERKFYRIHHKSRNFTPIGLEFIKFNKMFLNTEG